jgi:hydrogenase/urease accessory protein HupE
MKKITIKKIVPLLACLASPAVFAHTGIHTGIYHPLSGVDHFLMLLIGGLLAGVATYYFYKK